MSNLFSEFDLKGFKIKNRLVMPPMVCFGCAKEDGLVTDWHVKHYEARAKGGVGLIIIEATCVNSSGRLSDSQLGLWSDNQTDGFRKIAEACHNYGAKVLVQIHHAGFKTANNVSEDLVAPSDYNANGISARALSLDEIHSLQEDFVNAAVRAKEAGIDGIELHGAHGYLISQFMSPLVNKREDEYGGSLSSRARFALEIINQIKEKVSDNFIIGYRMGANEPTLENGIEIAKLLEKHRVDLLHVSTGITGEEHPVAPEDFNYNWIVYCGTQIKEHVNVPVIAVNGIKTPDRANYLVENGLVDFAAIGKGLLIDAEWLNKARSGASILECLDCKRCTRFKSEKLCPQYR